MRIETLIIVIKTYYDTLNFIKEEDVERTLIKINELELEFWSRTGIDFKSRFSVGGFAI